MQTLGADTKEPHKGLLDHLCDFAAAPTIEAITWKGLPPGLVRWDLQTVELKPSQNLPFWCFATAGCWQTEKEAHQRAEFILAAEDHNVRHDELLRMAAFLHLSQSYSIVPGKVMDIGQPWLPGSGCTHLLAQRPWIFVDSFEFPDVLPCTRYIWLMPITTAEADFARSNRVEELQGKFEAAETQFTDPFRSCIFC